MKKLITIPMLATMLIAGVTDGADDVLLKGDLAVLDAWVGTWQFDGAWSNGSILWSQAEYTPILGGAFLDGRVFVRDGDGELYQRYRSVFAKKTDANAVDAHTFSHDGSYAVGQLEVEDNVMTTEWSAGGTLISERMEIADGRSMSWKVWATAEGGEPSLIMDGVWHKIEAEAIEMPAKTTLATSLAKLQPLIGGWEIAAEWSDGNPLWSRSEYEVGLAGRFIDARTWTIDNEGNDYQRYETVFTADPDSKDGTVVSFSSGGAISASSWTSSEITSSLAVEILNETPTGGELLQKVDVEGSSFRWRVVQRPDPKSKWDQIMDGVWQRQGPPAHLKRFPVDPERFVSTGAMLRSFTKEKTIQAPVKEVFAAWTTSNGWTRLWGPPSVARIELAIGGRYEWLFNGWLGGNGSQILSYIPDRMVSFSWNAPPSQAENRLARTWVVVETKSIDATTTHVRLTHLGFGEGLKWDETHAYFDHAWDRVLELMANALSRDR